MRTLVFDIETVEDVHYTARDGFLELLWQDCQAPSNYKDPEKIEAERRRLYAAKRERLALSPRTGRICAIACGWLDDDEIECFTGNEQEIVRGFLREAGKHGRAVLAGFNIREFDIPFVAVRASLVGIDVPSWWPPIGRFDRFVADARDLLQDGKLADWLHCFELPPKNGEGSECHNMTEQQLRDYVTNDVRVERLLLRRLAHALPAIRDNRLIDFQPQPQS